jgi:phosphopantothenoylcysteine decarboxylase
MSKGLDSNTDTPYRSLDTTSAYNLAGTSSSSTQHPLAPFSAAEYASDGKFHILVAASGSVATIKIPQILQAFSKHPNVSVRVILTAAAKAFLAGQSGEQPPLQELASTPNVEAIYDDSHEWAHPWTRNAPILHIELRRWADIMVIAPLSANSLAKIVNGIADGLLTSVVRAWDTDSKVDGPGKAGKKFIVVAPAMNTAMWRQPITARQIRILEEDWGVKSRSADVSSRDTEADVEGWFQVLPPIGKLLACGDIGLGAMAEWQGIVDVIEETLGLIR